MKAEFIAYTATGTPIRTFDTRKLALEWWIERSCQFPGCRLEEVETQTIVTRRTVRGPRQIGKAAAS